MRRILLPVLAILTLISGCGAASQINDWRLEEVGPFSVIVSWKTDTPTVGKIRFGEGRLLDREIAESRPVTAHRVVLSGLKPSTMYAYRMEPAGVEAAFRSAPGKDGAFDMLVLDSDSGACAKPLAGFASLPDIIVLAEPCTGPIAHTAPSLLIVAIPERGVTVIRYGNAQLLLSRDLSEAESQPFDEADKNLRTIFVLPSLPPDAPSIADSVVLSPQGARHGGDRFAWDRTKTAWFEVDAFEVARVERDAQERDARESERVVILEAPPETKKTCLYCNRLMESGRYEQSIAWYRNFIEENKDRHAVEDAYYAIAEILDEKLLRFDAALKGYEEFERLYPSSRRASLVQYRVDYLRRRADRDFEPLRRFEKAKAGFTGSDPWPAMKAVESLLKDDPDSTVSEEALFWLSHALEPVDSAGALIRYRELIERFPHGENAPLAAIAVGDLFYKEKQYTEAIAAYTGALRIAPDTYRISLEDKLRKSRRNVNREAARWFAWAVLGGWCAATLVWRPRPLKNDLLAAFAVALAYLVGGGVYFAVAFETAGGLIVPSSVLGAAMCAVFFWNRCLSRRTGQKAWILVVHALTASLSAVYLIMYSFHYLYVFRV